MLNITRHGNGKIEYINRNPYLPLVRCWVWTTSFQPLELKPRTSDQPLSRSIQDMGFYIFLSKWAQSPLTTMSIGVCHERRALVFFSGRNPSFDRQRSRGLNLFYTWQIGNGGSGELRYLDLAVNSRTLFL